MRFELKRKLPLNDFDNFNVNYYMNNKFKYTFVWKYLTNPFQKLTKNAPNSQNTSGLVNLKYANIKLYQDNLVTHLPRTRQVKSLSPMSQVLKLIHFS